MMFFVFLFLSGCTPPISTNTVSSTPTQSITPAPTETPSPSITPLPTIPTITPTFDISTITTATPAPESECPKENLAIIPDFPNCDNTGCFGGQYHERISNYLNAGGVLEELEKKKLPAKFIDLTGDGLKELIIIEPGIVFIDGCKNGEYTLLMELEGTQRTPYISDVVDINMNGIPEIFITNSERHAFSSIRVFEWNGTEFVSLIKNSSGNDVLGSTAFDYQITDTNKDGVKEIVATDNALFIPDNLPGVPLRTRTIILSWNGKNFVVTSIEYSPPEYRFQAIQDADEYTVHQQYEQALDLYQDAIFNKELEWWSPERQEHETYTSLNSYFIP